MASPTSAVWPNLAPKEIYNFITGDFEQFWNALSSISGSISRGNFAFALLDMILVEFISRFCKQDSTGVLLRNFSNCLYSIDKRYFGIVSGWNGLKSSNEFTIPFKSQEGKEILCLMFDSIRNGEAHQYQQIIAELQDSILLIRISGADYGLNLAGNISRSGHLDGQLSQNSEKKILLIQFRPEVMFLDLKRAVECSQLLNESTNYPHFSRKYQDITLESVQGAIGMLDRLNDISQGKGDVLTP
jgi:hypothetical protein